MSTPGRKRSPRSPGRFEFELCESCHRRDGMASRTDVGVRFDPNGRSYHPVEAPSVESSPSLVPSLSGAEINCTDCHGNDDPTGARGPHGSRVRFILRSGYATLDGGQETEATYALCYGCHVRERVLDSPRFPLHRLHVVEERASCATCHDPHGSRENRALIRFGEEAFLAGAGPSAQAGILAFDSDGPGSGTCYLTCHGYDHAPAVYGGVTSELERIGTPTGEDGRLRFRPRSGSRPRSRR